jgi:DNA-binding response OmpR family regulator
MVRSSTVLLVSTNPEDHYALSNVSDVLGFRLIACRRLSQAEAAMQSEPPGVVISCVQTPDGSWRDIVAIAERLPDPPPVIVAVDEVSGSACSEILRSGASDMLIRPLQRSSIEQLLRKTIVSSHGASTLTARRAAR